MKMKTVEDPMGQAILDYYHENKPGILEAESQISDWDEIPTPWLFRSFPEMPKIEQKAIELCHGKVLDVGAAAGSHSLELQDRGLDVSAMDISTLSLQVAQKRGVKKTINQNFFHYNEQKYDTLLFMMNGIGIAATLNKLPLFFEKSRSLLNSGGQLILDSSDIEYMYLEDAGEQWVDLNAAYYGELSYTMRYKTVYSPKFDWLFVDFNRLKHYANLSGFKCEQVLTGEHHDYLARIW